MNRSLTLLALSLASGLAQANFLDASELRARCESSRVDFVNTCLGYLTGVADAENAAPAWRMQKSLFCVPQGVTGRELRLLVVDYFREHPEEDDVNASIVVGNAFVEAYPCE